MTSSTKYCFNLPPPKSLSLKKKKKNNNYFPKKEIKEISQKVFIGEGRQIKQRLGWGGRGEREVDIIVIISITPPLMCSGWLLRLGRSLE